MIYESYPWKQDLLRRRRLILKYNCGNVIEDERAYTVIEKAVFYSAFIIRKLLDCRLKVSDAVDNYKFTVKWFIPKKPMDLMHRWVEEDTHDLEHEMTEDARPGRDICNWLIHSFVFLFGYNEDNKIDSFYVSSDFDKDKRLYRIELSDWMAYMEFVGNDSVVSLQIHFDKDKKEYITQKKLRWTKGDEMSAPAIEGFPMGEFGEFASGGGHSAAS